jgi:hypothetical protein
VTLTSREGFFILGFSDNSPASFCRCDRPLEADSWLCTTESKFGLLDCTEYQKTLYAAQELRGVGGAWWASYIATLLDDHHVPWGEFYTAFCAHHLSTDLLHSKLKEFLDLEQGNHSVFDYTRQFNTLAQYGHTTSTQMKRRPTCTMRGSPSICRSAWYIYPSCRTTSW